MDEWLMWYDSYDRSILTIWMNDMIDKMNVWFRDKHDMDDR